MFSAFNLHVCDVFWLCLVQLCNFHCALTTTVAALVKTHTQITSQFYRTATPFPRTHPPPYRPTPALQFFYFPCFGVVVKCSSWFHQIQNSEPFEPHPIYAAWIVSKTCLTRLLIRLNIIISFQSYCKCWCILHTPQTHCWWTWMYRTYAARALITFPEINRFASILIPEYFSFSHHLFRVGVIRFFSLYIFLSSYLSMFMCLVLCVCDRTSIVFIWL